MAWIYLIIAGLLEVAWAYSMKLSEGFTRTGPTVFTLVTMALSVGLLSLSMRTLPLGTAYAAWTGTGAVGAVLVGAWVLGEQLTPMRGCAVLLIVSGMVLLKLAD